MLVKRFSDGIVILGDSTSKEVFDFVKNEVQQVPLFVCDPPYGNIVGDHINCQWDKVTVDDKQFAAWMVSWTKLWSQILVDGGAFYTFGGYGIPNFRPFFRYIVAVEEETDLKLSAPIVWAKKRAYGIKWGYLSTREELAYFVKGDIKKPHTFHIPLLEKKRGYGGYNKKYPALSEFFRRTLVWTDVTEILRGKVHETQKAQRVVEIPIEVHTEPGEYVVDLFAGSGTTAFAARKLGRKFVVIEKLEKDFDEIVKKLS